MEWMAVGVQCANCGERGILTGAKAEDFRLNPNRLHRCQDPECGGYLIRWPTHRPDFLDGR